MSIRPFIALFAVLLACQSTLAGAEAGTARQGTRTIRISEVHAVAVYTRGEKQNATGGTTVVTVRVQPNESRFASVGLLEEFVGGAGDQWKASSWIAAFVASEAAGEESLSDREYVVKVRGHIDGPSAGMLLAASMLACLRGDTVLQDVTVTGTVNPDGTIGPVDGIIQKLKGAKDAGLKRFGYPAGCRMARDLHTDKLVDVEEFARQIGIEAVEIADLPDAYRLLTGNQLARPEALAESGVTPPAELVAKLEKAARDIAAELSAGLQAMEEAIRTAPEKARRDLQEKLAALRGMLRDPGELDGDEAVARYYSEVVRAEILNRWLETQLKISEPRQKLVDLMTAAGKQGSRKEDPKKMAGDAKTAAIAVADVLESRITEANDALHTVNRTLQESLSDSTVGGMVDALQGYLTWWEARTKLECARASLQELRRTAGSAASASAPVKDFVTRLLDIISQTSAHLAAVKPRARTAANWTVFSSRQGGQAKVDGQFFRSMGHAYSCAAAAGIAYCDSLIEASTRSGSDSASSYLENHLRSTDPEYAQVRREALSFGEADGAGSTSGAEPVSRYIEQLGSGLYAYLIAAERTNRYYNYGARHNAEGFIELFENPEALEIALNEARRRTLEDCATLRRVCGFIPDSITINYQLSGELRKARDAEARLAALSMYWRCHQIARLCLSLQTHILR